MKITEVRIFQKEDDDKKLRAFATITFDDCFVIRDIKVIEGAKGYFVAMPSRRVKEACSRCRHGNVAHSRYCNQCGASLEGQKSKRAGVDSEDSQSRVRQSEHRDIAHPITAEFREVIQRAVLEAYEKEKLKLEGNMSSARSGS